MKILLLTRYSSIGPSSRLRFYQYLPYLKEHGIDVEVAPLLGSKYIEDLYRGKKRNYASILRAYLQRIGYLTRSRRFDLIWIEYEILPWLPEWCERVLNALNIPYIVDYDDAIFHRYEMNPNRMVRSFLKHKIDRIMGQADVVVAGNGYLADRAKQAGAKRIVQLPTVVDLDRYRAEPSNGSPIFKIGWIGTPSTAGYLQLAETAITEVCGEPNTRLVLVGSGPIQLNGLDVEIRPWTEDTEAMDILDFDVGIMPMPSNSWTRGKCGYKLIQYMACSRSVVASRVGVNPEIVENGVHGFLVERTEEWVTALKTLRENHQLRKDMGRRGRHRVEQTYCLQVTAPRLLSLIQSVAR
ncbi:MAG: glycosyltransferase family 4 protein [Desulfobacterales bacterium]|nr:glycosyltransferase family 4 protein [Desulfobacterales bacterium]